MTRMCLTEDIVNFFIKNNISHWIKNRLVYKTLIDLNKLTLSTKATNFFHSSTENYNHQLSLSKFQHLKIGFRPGQITLQVKISAVRAPIHTWHRSCITNTTQRTQHLHRQQFTLHDTYNTMEEFYFQRVVQFFEQDYWGLIVGIYIWRPKWWLLIPRF